MVSFTPVNPADIPDTREGRRGRISYPLMKSFLEQNVKCAKLNLAGINRRPDGLRTGLHMYIRKHGLPIRIFGAGGELYLMRLDLDNDGNPIPGWAPDAETRREKETFPMFAQPQPQLQTQTVGGPLITDDEVDTRFSQETGRVETSS